MLQKVAKSSFFRVPLVGTVLLEIDFFFFSWPEKKVGLQWPICTVACWLPPTKFSFPSLLKLKCSIVSQLQQWTHLQQISKASDMRPIYLYALSLLCIWHRNLSLRQLGVCLPFLMACLNERHVKLHFDRLRRVRTRQIENVFLVRNCGFIQIKIFRKKTPDWFGWQSAEKSNVFLICRIS